MTVRPLLHAFMVFGTLVSAAMSPSEAADQPQHSESRVRERHFDSMQFPRIVVSER